VTDDGPRLLVWQDPGKDQRLGVVVPTVPVNGDSIIVTGNVQVACPPARSIRRGWCRTSTGAELDRQDRVDRLPRRKIGCGAIRGANYRPTE
jgi:hypothetical protein